MTTVALARLLDIACDGGSLAQALALTSAAAVLDAANQELIQVVDRTHGVVGAHWAITCATALQQSNDLYVQLLPAGRDHLRSA